MKFEIKSRFTGTVLFSLECGSLKLCVEAAVKSGADLYGANLGDANLGDADLGGANLYGRKLSGSRPLFQLGPIGSRNDYLLSFVTDQGVMIRAGCFFGTRNEFEAAINETHGDNEYGQEYRAALALIDKHAELWPAIAEV